MMTHDELKKAIQELTENIHRLAGLPTDLSAEVLTKAEA